MIAVASPAVRVGEAIEMKNTNVANASVDCFFHDRHDIVAVFDYNVTLIRETQLIKWEFGIACLFFIASLYLDACISGEWFGSVCSLDFFPGGSPFILLVLLRFVSVLSYYHDTAFSRNPYCCHNQWRSS